MTHRIVVVLLSIATLVFAEPTAAKADPALAGKWEVGAFEPDGSFGTHLAAPLPRGGAWIPLLDRPDTIYLLTDSRAYQDRTLGDLTGATLTAGIGVHVTPGTAFGYYGEPDGSGIGATVRLYFETSASLGNVSCPCQEKGDASFWYSAPLHAELASLIAADATLSVPLIPSMWADAQERPGDSDPAQALLFARAVTDVAFVGLVFGGGRHFHNGAGIRAGTGSGAFLLRTFAADW